MAKTRQTKETPGYKELKAEIREGQCRNLYVIYGEETFLIDKLVDSLTELLVSPGCESLDRVVMNAGGQTARLDLEKLKAEVLTPPFISRRKLVIVRQSGWFTTGAGGRASAGQSGDLPKNDEAEEDTAESEAVISASSQKSRQEQLVSLLEKLPDSVCLVMIEQKVDRRLKQLVSMIEQKGVLSEIGREQPRTLQIWIDAECRRRGITIEAAASESLTDRCDGSMQVIWQEMNKLFLYCTYAGCKQVDLQLIADISLPDLRGNIFDLTDALSEGKIEKALLLVDTLISQKQPVQLIQFMLARHIRQLICATELGRPDRIASELKIIPFVANRLANQARRLSLPDLETLYTHCYDMDMLVKTGQIGDRLALETLLVTAAGLVGKPARR